MRFSSGKVHGQTIFRGIDEFTNQVSQRLRSHLTSAGVGCSAVRRSFKPAGSGFTASCTSGDYFVTVCAEREALPAAEVTIWADPHGDAVRSWSWFEPLFRRAVESEFVDPIKWMTIDQYVESGPAV
ncbi:MAG: hypothetical protein JWQ71_1732 [Pedosphaera sp.]|nr:hypothetical protein [Pedosphaera sp.]